MYSHTRTPTHQCTHTPSPHSQTRVPTYIHPVMNTHTHSNTHVNSPTLTHIHSLALRPNLPSPKSAHTHSHIKGWRDLKQQIFYMKRISFGSIFCFSFLGRFFPFFAAAAQFGFCQTLFSALICFSLQPVVVATDRSISLFFDKLTQEVKLGSFF